MNTMNLPGFTAEDSLYKTSAHYQTGRHGINSSTPMIGTIHVAAINVPGETIVIVEQWPPDPWTPPSWEGHGPGMPVPGQREPSGPRGGIPVDDRPKKPTFADCSNAGQKCPKSGSHVISCAVYRCQKDYCTTPGNTCAPAEKKLGAQAGQVYREAFCEATVC